MRQLALSFEPGLTDNYKTLEDMCSAVVYSGRGGLETAAAAMDQSPSELSRRLNAHRAVKEGDVSNRPLRVSDMVGIIDEKQDFRPIYWQIEKFLKDPEVRRQELVDELHVLLPRLQSLLEATSATSRKGRR